MSRTLIWVIATVPLGIFARCLAAVLLNRKLLGTSSTGPPLPALADAVVAAALLWTWILQPDIGIANTSSEALTACAPKWLASTEWALPSLR